MTDRVNISPGHPNVPASTAKAFANAGGDWIVKNTETLIADEYGPMAAGPYESYNHTGTSGFDVTIDTGEAVVGGACIARDTTTSVTLASSTSNQTVYLGWDTSQQDTVIVGLDSAFPADTPRVAIWEFDTDGSTVTTATRLLDPGRDNAVTNLSYSKADADERFVSKSGGGLDADLDFQGNAALNMAVDARAGRPSSPHVNQFILRTDTSPQRLEINTSKGWRVSDLKKLYPDIERFETGDYLPRWDKVDGGYSGSTTVTNAAAISGEYGLNATDFTQIVSMPADGLADYPNRGDDFRVHCRINNSGNNNQYWIGFLVQSSNFDDFYSAELIMGSGSGAGFRIQKHSTGGTTEMDADFNIPNYVDGRVYRVEISLRGGDDIFADLIDTTDESTIASLSAIDSEYSGGGLALRSSTNGDVDWDDLEMDP